MFHRSWFMVPASFSLQLKLEKLQIQSGGMRGALFASCFIPPNWHSYILQRIAFIPLTSPHGILSIQAHTMDFASLPLTLDGDFLPEIAASAEDADLGDGHHACGRILSALSR